VPLTAGGEGGGGGGGGQLAPAPPPIAGTGPALSLALRSNHQQTTSAGGAFNVNQVDEVSTFGTTSRWASGWS